MTAMITLQVFAAALGCDRDWTLEHIGPGGVGYWVCQGTRWTVRNDRPRYQWGLYWAGDYVGTYATMQAAAEAIT